MKEKERYKIHIYDDVCVDLYDNGVLDKSINDIYKLEELLNQQDKIIKELEQENLKSGNYEVVDNQGFSVTQHFIECLEKEFANLEAKLKESEKDKQEYKTMYFHKCLEYAHLYEKFVDIIKKNK